MPIKSKRDVWAGGLVMLLGVGAILEGRRHSVGTLAEIGPGAFPMLLGAAMAVVGLLIAGFGLMSRGEVTDEMGHAIELPDWRGCSAIVLGILAFILLGHTLGLAPATFACAAIAGFGDRTATVRGTLLLAVGLTAMVAVVFWWLLQIPFPLFRLAPLW